jgi:hypothetical protein
MVRQAVSGGYLNDLAAERRHRMARPDESDDLRGCHRDAVRDRDHLGVMEIDQGRAVKYENRQVVLASHPF